MLGALVAASSLLEPGSPIERAIEYLAARTDRTIALADVAAAVQVSPSHLSALFQRATGGGVLAYHTSLKMAVARNLLDTTDISIRQVASAVGYGDQLYFSRQFRQHHGQSPGPTATVSNNALTTNRTPPHLTQPQKPEGGCN